MRWDHTYDVREKDEGQVSVLNYQAAEKQWLIMAQLESLSVWLLYIELLQNYVANDVVTAKKKHAILLSVCGACTYQLICNLTTHVIPSLKSYEDLVVKLVREHYSPRSQRLSKDLNSTLVRVNKKNLYQP